MTSSCGIFGKERNSWLVSERLLLREADLAKLTDSRGGGAIAPLSSSAFARILCVGVRSS